MDQEEISHAIRANLLDYTQKVHLARATDLARSKRYMEAEALLCPMGQLPENPKELDLLARIAFRRWRPAEARRFWEAAIRVDPENENYRQCLGQLLHYQRKRRFLSMIAAIIFSIALLTIGGISLLRFNAAHKDRPATPSPEARP